MDRMEIVILEQLWANNYPMRPVAGTTSDAFLSSINREIALEVFWELASKDLRDLLGLLWNSFQSLR